MARKYFAEAVTLDPSDARYLGFLAASILAEGAIHKDEKLTRKGYFMLRDSIQAWPEFNLFTAGYVMSQQPADSPRFREGLDWEWRNLDVCAQGRSIAQTRIIPGTCHLKLKTGRSALAGIPGSRLIISKVFS